MSTVPESRLKGNYGAAIVMARLSRECLVRPVAGDTDIGVDLYCETVVDGKPFLHFWVQVKSGSQCKLHKRGNRASCRFDASHLEYWRGQPVPVFAALVPMDWPPSTEPDVYLIDVTTGLLGSKGTSGRTMVSDHHWSAGDAQAVSGFLLNEVPASTARLQISRGVVGRIPTIAPGRNHQMPRVPVLAFKDQILLQLRTTAACSMLFAPVSNPIAACDERFMETLAGVVAAFDPSHWEVPAALGIAAHLKGDFNDAISRYLQAQRCIETEIDAVGDGSAWTDILASLERHRVLATAGQPPPTDG